jgi:hypothetical protein
MLQPLQERCEARLHFRIVRGQAHEDANAPHPLGLLRTRRQRPRSRAAEERDELAPSDVEHGGTQPRPRLILAQTGWRVLGATSAQVNLGHG